LNQKLENILQLFKRDLDGIYNSSINVSLDQSDEIKLRERVAFECSENLLDTISLSHSITVMDYEVDRFLERLPKGSLILDIGGCWGWHWRYLAEKRPDVGVLIIDFVRLNLTRAQNILGGLVGNQVALLHADPTALPIDIDKSFKGFDGVWTVQTFQHIPNFTQAVKEAYRVLRPEGFFVNYSLHITPLHQLIFWFLRKQYHFNGVITGLFYLARASDDQSSEVAKIFGTQVVNRYTECLFHPQFGLHFTGSFGKLVGKIDILLTRIPYLARLVARQRSFEVFKKPI